ncbi:DNA glycosylase [Bipolaris maydis]|nr:DNA glycosylase [Bipolaris maydis]KAJ6199051.1 DNA glycosylase [Bipolaris maydis]
MPWRKAWINPADFEGREEELKSVLSKRAYEVWVSEVMLQQTRVSTVIPYFNNWIAKWPTVEDLAAANHDDVLSVWKGLGYYSRATRLHEGAKQMTSAPSASGVIPSGAAELQQVPGIGRYTAGAVSSIAFGEPEPVLDGNVARVLSRQLGLYMDAKDKKTTDIMWDMADQLIKFASNYPEQRKSAVPGLWNQALMELGSTVCTPRPRCDECPIQATCRTYSEGKALSEKRQASTAIPDIEDACMLCAPLDTEDLVTIAEDEATDDAQRATKKRKAAVKQTNTLSNYFTVSTSKTNADTETDQESADDTPVEESKKRKLPPPASDIKPILSYCSLFPMKFPQVSLTASQKTPQQRKALAQKHVADLAAGKVDMSQARYVASLSPLVHVFTHLKLTMHAYQFRIDADNAKSFEPVCKGPPARKWVDGASMDDETLSTGMRRCWDLLASEK